MIGGRATVASRAIARKSGLSQEAASGTEKTAMKGGEIDKRRSAVLHDESRAHADNLAIGHQLGGLGQDSSTCLSGFVPTRHSLGRSR